MDAECVNLPKDTHTFSVSFAGYNQEKGQDDLVYVSVNTHWEDRPITLPKLRASGAWHLCINTFGDGHGKYFYREGEEIRINHNFIMRPRSVAVFVWKLC